MSQFYKENFYESGEGIDLNERNVRLAFTVEPVFGTKIMKNDPSYVKFLVRLSGKREGKDFQRILPHYKCTDEDYNKFYPVENNSKILLESLKSDPDRGLFCINWDEDEPLELAGEF